MSLLSALKLPSPPSPPGGKAAAPAGSADIDRLREEIGAGMKAAVQLAGALTSTERKLALVEALKDADTQRQAADRMTDPANRLQALKAAKSRIETATARAKAPPGGATAAPANAPAATAASSGSASSSLSSSSSSGSPGKPAASVRDAALALKPALEAELKAAHAAYGQADAAATAADAAVKAAAKSPAWEKKVAADDKAAADKHLAAVQQRLKQLDADVTALASKGTSDEAYQAILARQKAAASFRSADAPVTVPRSGLSGEKTVQASGELKDGKATSSTDERSRKVGVAEVTDKRDRTTVGVDGSGQTQTTSTSRSTTLGLAGVSDEKTRKQQYDKDGQTTSVERKSSVGVTADGTATASKTVTTTGKDGSGTERKTTLSGERKDGKITGTLGHSRTGTDAAGVATKVAPTAKGGVSAGKDGIGGGGDGELAYEKARPGGMKTGAVGGLSANIVANIVADSKDPTKYVVTVSIDLGARINLSSGYDKDPDKGKPDEATRATAKVSAGASGKVTMKTATPPLDAAQLNGYVEALKSGQGTGQEFAVIQCGLNEGWPSAQRLYLGLSGQIASQASVDGLAAGGSMTAGKERKLSGGVDVGTKGGTIGGGVSVGGETTSDGSITVSKDDKGQVSYDLQQGDSLKGTVGARVNAGVAEGGFSMGRTLSTSTGYKLAIPAGTEPKLAAEMQKAMNACNGQADLDAFAKKYPKAVQESTVQKGTADTREVTAGVGGQLKIGGKFGNAVDESQTRDADGKLKESRVTGSTEGGAELSLFGQKIADSSKEQAVSTRDGQGNVRTDVTQTDTSTDLARLAGALPFSGDKGAGALSKATGGADTSKKTVSGLGLGDAQLTQLGQMACGDWNAWMYAPVNADDRKAWATAGNEIKKAKGDKEVVAEAIARFAGSGCMNPKQVIFDTIRGRKGTGGGDRYEFPDALVGLKPEYDKVVVAASETAVQGQPPEDAKKAADALLASLETLYRAVNHATDFKNPSARAEMLAAITARKGKVRAALKASSGAPTAPSLDEHKLRFNDLLASCRNYQEDEKKLFAKVQANLKGGGHTAIENTRLVNELKSLYAVWDPQYEEMATLAQTHDLGKGIFDRYRPDRKTFQLAYENKTLLTDKGEALAPLEADSKNRKVDPAAKTDEQKRAERQAEDQERIRKGTQIQKELPVAQKQAWDRSQLLDSFLTAERKAAAAKVFGDGARLYDEAVALREKVHPDNMPELVKFGAPALDRFRAALALFNRGIAAYPKDWTKTGR